MLREIVLDTETTGTEANNGDRLVEIGCVELINHCPTGESFHCYLNPERLVQPGAFAVHGLSDAFLSDKPLFADIAADFEAFCGDSRLIIHNASFDVGFINMERKRLDLEPLIQSRIVDTLSMARRKHPGASNSLDALCSRYGIDNSKRTRHGALLDAELLAEVYIELIGGKQADLGLGPARNAGNVVNLASARPVRQRPVVSALDPEAIAAHEQFVSKLSGSLWADYLGLAKPQGKPN
ncbi:MAG: DNA polymerase III subunit epsilon [Bosea sp. (in: a-proteobacteria)]